MTRPELTVAVAGEKNTARAYNDNNTAILDYIDESITATNQTLETRYSGIATQITNLNNLITANQESEQTDIAGVYATLGTNGLYITTSFNTTTGNWYREFFSDSNKTTRVWLETGGTYTADSVTNRTAINDYVLVFPKSFTNDKFYFQRSVHIKATSGDLSNRYVMYNSKNYSYVSGREAEGKLSNVVLDIAPYNSSYYFTYYACGV